MDCEEKKEVKQEEKEIIFDLTEQYKDKIIPLAEQLINACQEIGLPYLMHFVIANHDEGRSVGLLASAQDKHCIATGNMMMVANMLDGKGDMIPVPINKDDPMSLLAAVALAGLATKKD
jgi:hypothetical protein